MGAATILIGEDKPDRVGPALLFGLVAIQHLSIIIMVHDRHIALTFEDGLGLRAIIALRLAGEIRHHAIRPGLGGGGPVRGDDRCHQRPVIDMASLAAANTPLPLRVGKILDIGYGAFATRSTEVATRRARVDRANQRLSAARRCAGTFAARTGDQPAPEDQDRHIHSASDIDRQNDIRRACLAFGKKTLRQPLRGIDNTGPDPGLCGKGVKEGLQQELLAM